MIMSQNKTISKPKSPRYFFVDFVRFFSMIAIAHFHLHEATFFENAHHFEHGFLEVYIEPYSRFMAFSGFSIVLLSYFLIGLKGLSSKKLVQLVSVAGAGALLIFLIFGTSKLSSLEWDIYPFIGVSSLVIALLSQAPRLLYAIAFFGFAILFLPPEFWDFPSLQNSFYYNAVFGNYWIQGMGSWPLLPWLGVPTTSYALGYYLRSNPQVFSSLSKISYREICFWVVPILMGTYYWGAFFEVPIGPDFYKFVHRMPRLPLFSHLVVVVFLMRLGLVHAINKRIEEIPSLRWISRLYLNRKFFLFYIVSWAYIGIFASFEPFYTQNPPSFDLVVFGPFPLTEMTCSGLFKILNKIRGPRAH